MPSFKIPTHAAESLRGGSDEPQPEGAWEGQIEEVRMKEIPTNERGEPFKGFTSADGEIATIIIGSQRPLEGQEEWGERKLFLDLTLRDGSLDLFSVPEGKTDAWQLQRSQRQLANLALALGLAQMGDDGVEIDEGAVDAIKDGQIQGLNVGYKLYHRSYISKKGTPEQAQKVAVEVETFFPA